MSKLRNQEEILCNSTTKTADFATKNTNKTMSSPNFCSYGPCSPMLTDLYQITMVYGYWKAGKQNDHAAFDLYFRKNPFRGEFTIFAGLQECLNYIENFKITDEGR
jgi:nicotinate phosphoribosyltransferase